MSGCPVRAHAQCVVRRFIFEQMLEGGGIPTWQKCCWCCWSVSVLNSSSAALTWSGSRLPLAGTEQLKVCGHRVGIVGVVGVWRRRVPAPLIRFSSQEQVRVFIKALCPDLSRTVSNLRCQDSLHAIECSLVVSVAVNSCVH